MSIRVQDKSVTRFSFSNSNPKARNWQGNNHVIIMKCWPRWNPNSPTTTRPLWGPWAQKLFNYLLIRQDLLLIIGDWNGKVGSQEIPGITGRFGLGVQNEAGQRLIEFCQENTLLVANTLFQQYKGWLYTWTSPDGQYWNQIDYILCSRRWSSSIQSAKTRPGADCGSDHELLIAKFRFKLRKIGSTTRPFHYDVNLTPYDYTVEVTKDSRD